MSYESEIDSALQQIMQHPEIRRVINDPNNGVDERFISARIKQQHEQILTDLGNSTSNIDAATLALERARATIAADKWPRPMVAVVVPSAAFVGIVGVLHLSALTGLNFGNGMLGTLSAILVTPGIGFWEIVFYFGCFNLFAAVSYHLRRRSRQRELEQGLDIPGKTEMLASARAQLEQMLHSVLLQNTLQIINQATTEFFQDHIRLPGDGSPPTGSDSKETSGRGLSEVVNAANEVPTEARENVLRLINTLPGASIGLSGPRGVGKSTLLSSICGGNPRIAGKKTIAIYTAAPVEYDSREFLLHVYSTLCHQVLASNGREDLFDAKAPLWRDKSDYGHRIPLLGTFGITRRKLASLLFVAAFISTGAGILLALALATLASIPAPTLILSKVLPAIDLKVGPLILTGVTTFILGVLVLILPFLDRRLGYYWLAATPRDALVKKCIDALQDIRFQRSYTEGWSGALKIPVGFDVGSSGGMSLSQKSESLPELVQQFRVFVGDVTQEYDQVIIGIDELDKLKSPEIAERFLNEIKSIFNLAQCFYLVSVSEDALSGFDRRGLSIRDAFDSAFDDIVYINYLTLIGARNLLYRRVLNLPGPFLCLCHVLSGGLPRDLIRIARAMLEIVRSQNGVASLQAVALALVRMEAENKLRATAVAASQVPLEPDATNTLIRIADVESIIASTKSITTFAAARMMPRHKEADAIAARRLHILCKDLATYLDFLILTNVVFSSITSEAAWKVAVEKGQIEGLARAKQGLEKNVGVAELRIRKLRQEFGL